MIERAGLPKPGKSSCFFCPSMKKKEIQALWENYPDLFQRAIALEHGSAARNVNVKGLGRDWSWESYYNEFMENKAFEDAQITFDELFPDSPGGCLCGAPVRLLRRIRRCAMTYERAAEILTRSTGRHTRALRS